MTSRGYFIEPLRFNSQCISFQEWVSLFTLCLAPLFAHILAGTPKNISYLTKHRPRWYQHMCHYNPTSILWRYAAITDRRIRALEWSNIDMAASNAVFWTDQGWCGSEYMVQLSAPFCTELPPRNRTELVSITTLKTIITTAQGISATYTLIFGATKNLHFLWPMGLDNVFFPLAVLSLLRIFAAAWLTDHYGYMLQNGIEMRPLPPITTANNIPLIARNNTSEWSSVWFKPPSFWLSWAFRTLYASVLLGFYILIWFHLMPGIFAKYTTTVFLCILFYFVFLTITIFTFAIYFVNGSIITTIIPCIDAGWYQLYTFLFGVIMVALIVIASIETNRTSTGGYTSQYTNIGAAKCADASLLALPLVSESGILGLFSEQKINAYLDGENRNTSWAGLELQNTLGGHFWAYNFSGYCLGVPLNTTIIEY